MKAWSVAIFDNRFVFHHIGFMTSSFVHLGPAFFFYTLRWGRHVFFAVEIMIERNENF